MSLEIIIKNVLLIISTILIFLMMSNMVFVNIVLRLNCYTVIESYKLESYRWSILAGLEYFKTKTCFSTFNFKLFFKPTSDLKCSTVPSTRVRKSVCHLNCFAVLLYLCAFDIMIVNFIPSIYQLQLCIAYQHFLSLMLNYSYK